MTYSRPWNSYRQTATQTASPGQLVLMLYDGALKFLEKSLYGFEMEDPAESNQMISNNIIRAQNIIAELNGTLNLNDGGALAVTLRGLYNYMDDRLMESNLRKNPEGVRDTIHRLSALRDAWQQMLQGVSSPGTPSATSAGPAHGEAPVTPSLCVCG